MIRINDTYVIDVGSNNYTLCRDEKKKNKNGEDVYTPVSYHGGMAEAIRKARAECIRNAVSEKDMIDIVEVFEIIKKIDEEFKGKLDRAFEIIEKNEI